MSFRIAMTALSDQPVKTVEEDELDFDVYSGALVDFIRREKTHTPLTLGIDAPWGQGKTSLMKMMRTELERYGLLTVWFNA